MLDLEEIRQKHEEMFPTPLGVWWDSEERIYTGCNEVGKEYQIHYAGYVQGFFAGVGGVLDGDY